MRGGPFQVSESGAGSTVLITGATGFSGSFLVERYVAKGWRVWGTTRGAEKDLAWLPAGVELVSVDLRDDAAVRDLVRRARPDVVFHLAAQSSVSRSWTEPMGTLTDNARCQFNVLEAVNDGAPEARVVVVGSADEYGRVEPEENPIAEHHELRPANPYALSKVVQDLMGLQYADRGIHVIRVRPFLQMGPRRAPPFVMGSFAWQIAEIERGRREPVLEVGDTSLVRDFTDVRDVARAYELVAEMGGPGDVFNIASGVRWPLHALLEMMLSSSTVRVEVRRASHLMRAGESPVLVGDASRLRQTTGWEPMIPAEQSVRDALDYWRCRPE